MFTSQSLLPYNSFGFNITAGQYAPVAEATQLPLLIRQAAGQPLFVLGGGSNILFTHDPEAVVLHNRILGRSVERETAEEVIVKVGGGENWHEVVQWTLTNNWGGAENLSLIPGTVGAAPIQNIGAYGVELKDLFYGLEAIDLSTGEQLYFAPEACQFGYRHSIFKTELKGKFLISQVFLKLTRRAHRIHDQYGAIRETLNARGIEQPSIQDISRAVISIRESKLPDPKQLGNAGSFFKNPEIDADDFVALQEKFPNLIYYPLPDGRYKLPAGWLIDQCGWRGKRIGPVGCYEHQALVLVNYGGATGTQILDLAAQVMESVLDTFGVYLEPEVNIL